MSFSKKEKTAIIILAIIAFALYFVGLFNDVTRDAAKYAYIAKQLFFEGEWLQLKINDELYFQKPQLLFWLSAISFKLFGISNFAFKLPFLLYSSIGFYSIFRLGKSIYNKKTGLTASAIAFFSVISILYHNDIHTDILLFSNVALSLWMFYDYVLTQKTTYLIFAGISMGLSFLTKGPFGIVIPIFALAGHVIYEKKYTIFRNPNWLIFLAVFALMCSPAIIPLLYEKGFKGLWFILWDNNARRITGDFLGANNDFLFFFHNLLYLFLPWTLFLFWGLGMQWKGILKNDSEKPNFFLFSGTWLFLAIISISGNKLPNYLLSLVPILSIITSERIVFLFEKGSKKIISIQEGLLILLWIVIFAIPLFIIRDMPLPVWGLVAFTFGLYIYSWKTTKTNYTFFIRTLITFVAIASISSIHVFPTLFKLQGTTKAAKLINELVVPGEKVYNFDPENIEIRAEIIAQLKETGDPFFEMLSELHFYRNYEFMFYCNNRVELIESVQEITGLRDQKSFVFTTEQGLDVMRNLDIEFEVIEEINHFNLRRPAKYFTSTQPSQTFEKYYILRLSLKEPL
jgi:4-amino-4-deoxy-L-arabinose transferase-like glycosyltransferase